MQGNSDDEIIQLRNTALLSKPNNMRKRKVTLTSTRNIISHDNIGDRRDIVEARHVVIGATSPAVGLDDRAAEGTTGEQNILPGISLDSNSHGDTMKKPRLENDQRIFNVFEEKKPSLEEKNVEKDTGTEIDVRIVVNKNGVTEVEEERNIGDEEDHESLEQEEELVESESEEINDVEDGKDDNSNDDVEKSDEKLTLDDTLETDHVKTTDEKEIEDGESRENEEVDKEDKKQKEDQDNDLKKAEITQKKSGASEVTDKESNDITAIQVEPRTKGDKLANEGKTTDISEKANDKNNVNETKGSDDSSDNSGSESDSSDSSSSSGSSSGSSGSSSGSSSSSGIDSDTKSVSKSRSRSVSASSSSYSYSTSGSTGKKDTLRSVVTQTNRSLKQERQRSRSPRSRSRDRRDTGRRQSHERDDRATRDFKDGRRLGRDEGSRFPRRRSPYRRRENSRSPLYRRGSRERSREQAFPSRYGRSDDQQERRRPPMKNDRYSSDQLETDNPLSRTDDDYVEIDVGKSMKENEKTEKISEWKTNKAATVGADLRSRLGPKKSDEKPSKIDEEKRPTRTVARRSITCQDNTVTGKSDKELKLDARIERIRIMNEEIKKRKDEIAREKLLYG